MIDQRPRAPGTEVGAQYRHTGGKGQGDALVRRNWRQGRGAGGCAREQNSWRKPKLEPAGEEAGQDGTTTEEREPAETKAGLTDRRPGWGQAGTDDKQARRSPKSEVQQRISIQVLMSWNVW